MSHFIRLSFAIALIAVLIISIFGLYLPDRQGLNYGTLPTPKTLVTTAGLATPAALPYIDAANNLAKGPAWDNATQTITGNVTGNAGTATTATNVSGGTASVTSITDSGLTAGRIPIVGTAGLLGDDADLTWTGGQHS